MAESIYVLILNNNFVLFTIKQTPSRRANTEAHRHRQPYKITNLQKQSDRRDGSGGTCS